MFLCAVARQRCHDAHWFHTFDGKLGIWPFITVEATQCSSRNRPRGTMVTTPIASITSAVYWQFIIKKVLPATSNWGKMALEPSANKTSTW
jgi:hypothetical protein